MLRFTQHQSSSHSVKKSLRHVDTWTFGPLDIWTKATKGAA